MWDTRFLKVIDGSETLKTSNHQEDNFRARSAAIAHIASIASVRSREMSPRAIRARMSCSIADLSRPLTNTLM